MACECLCWPFPGSTLWDVTIYSLRLFAYAADRSGMRPGTMQAVTDLLTAGGFVLRLWLGEGVSRCEVSESLNPSSTLSGRGEWLWPAGLGRSGDSCPPLPSSSPRVVLYLHGGAFVLCNSYTHRVITYELVRRTGLPVCAPCYKRPPRAKFPQALEEMTDVYEGFVERYGAPNVVLAGDSAGANLCLAVALNARARDPGLPPPGCVVLISPWCDLSPSASSSPSMSDNAGTDYLPVSLIGKFGLAYLGPDGGGSAASDPLVSPALAPPSQLQGACPNTLLCYGTGEELMDQCRSLARSLGGGAARVCELEGMPHVAPLFAAPVYGA
eukprot:CAMPEP_0182461660 /NCGR_PEP_ID=MMETSP1319-20130603/6172_1 /TAXON_ID=172717 /ORGANISM="Bolidomonas pacifica, Strain RCC208" /LENGTH=326 /DNA_ID=CAMNT_0024660975 /DNA_START=339 /DNA_END=1315 /DNA_ORIENTATION=+